MNSTKIVISNDKKMRLFKFSLFVLVALYFSIFTNVFEWVFQIWDKGILYKVLVVTIGLFAFINGPMHLISLLRTAPIMVISREGIELHRKKIKWSDINNIEHWRHSGYQGLSATDYLKILFKDGFIKVNVTNADKSLVEIKENLNSMSKRTFKFD